MDDVAAAAVYCNAGMRGCTAEGAQSGYLKGLCVLVDDVMPVRLATLADAAIANNARYCNAILRRRYICGGRTEALPLRARAMHKKCPDHAKWNALHVEVVVSLFARPTCPGVARKKRLS